MGSLPKPDREELELRAHRVGEIERKLRELTGTDGWKTLIEVFTAAEQSYYAGLTRQLMQGRVIDQRKLDFNRGLFQGVRQLLQQPDKAETVLAKALQALEAANEE